ncbi:MAG: HEAT repeat domain-containing protein, partial [Candidatus Omnitrophica bacterium]|nr:HEAT repeat domain-containing protein [Candidatus Omnitrophota bacterium]
MIRVLIIIFIMLLCGWVSGEDSLYPDLTLPGPLPFEEEMIEPDRDDIIIDVNPAAVDLLISSLNEKDPAVRSQAAWALGDIGEQKSGDLNRKIVIALNTVMKDANPDVRVTAVSALAKIGGDEAVRGIINSIKDEDVRVRREAARALIRLKPEDGVSPLIESLNDHDYLVQKYDILALGAIGREEAIEPLKKTFSSGGSILKPEIISALARIGKKEVIPFIMSALLDSDPPTKGEACLALGHLEASEGMDSLLTSLKDGHFYVRRSAVWSIGKLRTNTDKSIHELISMLEDEDASVRLQTCITLAELEAEPALKPLEKRLADDDKFVRRSAARAIVDIGGSAIEVLMSSLTSENILSHQESAWALGYMAGIGGKVSAPPLLNSLKDKDTILRRNTTWALGKIKALYSVDALLESLSDNDIEVRRNSAWALGEVREKNALHGLI